MKDACPADKHFKVEIVSSVIASQILTGVLAVKAGQPNLPSRPGAQGVMTRFTLNAPQQLAAIEGDEVVETADRSRTPTPPPRDEFSAPIVQYVPSLLNFCMFCLVE